MKSILSSLSSIMLIGVVFLGVFYINQKLNRMNDMWMDANQIIVSNQKEQIKINRAYSDQIDKLTTYIGKLNQEERLHWLTTYNEEIQKFLSTPPSGLKPQGDL